MKKEKDFKQKNFINFCFYSKARNFLINHWGYVIIFIISLLVTFPLFSKGYIFTLDHVTHENAKKFFFDYLIGYSQENNGIFLTPLPIPNFLYMLALFIFGNLLSVEIFQKIFFLFLLFFSGATAYYVCPSNKFGKVFAGILYMINPFTYVRFLAGHTFLLLSYAFFPLFFKSLIEFSENVKELIKNRNLNRKSCCKYFSYISIKIITKISILATICIATTHYLPLILGTLVIFFIFDIFREKDIRNALILNYILIFLLFFTLNFYWIIPIAGETSPINKIEQFSELDLKLFSSRPSIEFNTIFNTISLHGFWRGGYDYAKYHISVWPLIFFTIFFFSVHGFLICKNKRKYIILFVVLVSSFIAIGIGYKPFENIIKSLYSRFEFLMGLREPHKLLVMLCLFYSYFGGIGVSDIINSIDKIKSGAKKIENKEVYPLLIYSLFAIIIALPLIYSYTMLFGFNGYLKPLDYPKGWYEINEFLKSDKEDFNVLFLPWHLYMDFKWIENYDKRIANPSRVFFEKPIISAENIEAGGIGSQTTNPTLRYIEFLLLKSDEISNFGELLSIVNVKYILLAKEVDWKNYLWLFDQEDLEIVKENENFIVFKNKKYKGRIYLAGRIISLESLEDILRISKEEDITNVVFGNEGKNYSGCESISIEYEKISPLEYQIRFSYEDKEREVIKSEFNNKSSINCIIFFASRYSKNWKLNGESSFNVLDIANAFEYNVNLNENKPIKIRYENMSYNLYLISIILFFALFFYYFKDTY